MTPWREFFTESLKRNEDSQSLRCRGGQQPTSDSTSIIDFGNNDYLGLRADASVVDSLTDLSEFGSGASPVLRGYSAEHKQLERTIADLSGFEDAVVFSSGFGCNVGVLSCLVGPGDLILSDQLNHASLIDGCRLSRAQVHVYPHNDLDSLEKYLRSDRKNYNRSLIVTESVFSMDGDHGRLVELAELSQRFDCGLIVDEAHALGIYGDQGSGLVEELDVHDAVLLKLGTLSKSVGGIGGYATGSRPAIEYLVNSCRSYLFSTSPPIAVVHAATKSLNISRQMRSERSDIRARSLGFRRDLTQLGWEVISPECDSPIVPILTGDNLQTLEIANALHHRGFYVPAIRPPTVPPGMSRLRISLSLRHSLEDIAGLLAALRDLKMT